MSMFAGAAGAVAGSGSAVGASGSTSAPDSFDASASIPPFDGFADEDEEEVEGEKDKKEKGPPDHAENDDEEDEEQKEDEQENGPPDHAKNDGEARNDPEEDSKAKQPDKKTTQKREDEQAPSEKARTGNSDGEKDTDSSTTRDEGTAENAKAGQQQKQVPPDQEKATDKPVVSVTTERSDSSDDGASDSDDQRNPDEAEDAGGEPSTVNVKVDGVDAGERVELDVKTEDSEDDEVAFDGISTTVKRGGSFTMRITSSREALPGSPAFDSEDGAESIGRIRLEHSITNDDVEDVSFTFRVSKQRLNQKGIDAGDVALYRHADGSWSALPSKVVGETTTHYVLTADSPGMSEFAIGAKRPSFELWDAGVTMSMVQVGEPTKIFGKVTNVGGADGVFTARLKLDGETVATRHLTIAAGGTRQVSFERPLVQPGRYELYVNHVHAGSVTVEMPEGSNKRGAAAVLFDWLPGLGLALGILGLITPAALVTLRSRRWF